MGLLARLKGLRRSSSGPPVTESQRLIARYDRRQSMETKLKSYGSLVSTVLIVIGSLWLLCIPVQQLGERVRVDEHALQPGQASIKYGWDSVQLADRLSAHLQAEFAALGLPTSSQPYTFQTSLGSKSGENTWAAFVPPRTSGTEAIVLAASWESLAFKGDFSEGIEEYNTVGSNNGRERMRNIRGVAMLLSIAEYLRGTNHYAKTIIFVISDDHLEGMQAFLSSYHGTHQSNLVAGDLRGMPKGVIWTALCVDYPGHSFSHIGLYFEGTNGRLPNQDVLNSVSTIAQYYTQIPVQLYKLSADLPSLDEFSTAWPRLSKIIRSSGTWHLLASYAREARGLWEHWFWAGLGRSSGVHGAFLQYRIDAITLFARPSSGPHGFHALGRLLEASLRSTNNLLERLHASLFFYLYPFPGWTVQVGSYLPAGVLIGSGITIRGLVRWAQVADGGRPVLRAAALVVGTHLGGWLTFWILTRSGTFRAMLQTTTFQPALLTTLALLFSLITFSPLSSSSTTTALEKGSRRTLEVTIRTFTHLITGLLIPTLSMLNFPQATLLGSVLLPPLFFHPFPSNPLPSVSERSTTQKVLAKTTVLLKQTSIILFSPPGILILCALLRSDSHSDSSVSLSGFESVREGVIRLIEEGEVSGDWCWVGVWVIWWPIWVQSWLAGWLAS
ncbi:Glycosylphosphatidylinositol anchor attachment protein GAA1 [Phaffia rhodozyma]|uniref:Glycosylphosphatidylinositol anchor attachment protein GAA1 n=1 Tax=Phaffia rhodozyma TaxID=264483 RepID=A0A0F7SH45_PHARH|nr:Glycosylphosphatidylinositol anchor attachment protein GAA1 [Phaffia rhodozyma]